MFFFLDRTLERPPERLRVFLKLFSRRPKPPFFFSVLSSAAAAPSSLDRLQNLAGIVRQHVAKGVRAKKHDVKRARCNVKTFRLGVAVAAGKVVVLT